MNYNLATLIANQPEAVLPDLAFSRQIWRFLRVSRAFSKNLALWREMTKI